MPTTVTRKPAGAGRGTRSQRGDGSRQRRAAARRRAELARASSTDRHGLPAPLLALGVAAAVALLLGVALVTGFLTPPGSTSAKAPAPAATLSTAARGGAAADVAVADGSAWVVDDSAGTIRRVDLSSGGFVGAARHIARRPVSVAAADGELWVADAVGNDVVVVDPRTGRATGTPIAVAAEPVSVAAGPGGIWVASLGAGTVSLVDPRARTVVASVALPDGAVRVATGDGAAWVTGDTDTLTRVSPKPVGVSLAWRAVRVGQGPIGVVAAPGAVWVADAVGGALTRVDPAHLRVTATYRIGSNGAVAGRETQTRARTGGTSDPVAVSWFDGLVWIGDGRAATVSAFDPGTGLAHGAPVALPGVPRRLVVAAGSLYATSANPAALVVVHPS